MYPRPAKILGAESLRPRQVHFLLDYPAHGTRARETIRRTPLRTSLAAYLFRETLILSQGHKAPPRPDGPYRTAAGTGGKTKGECEVATRGMGLPKPTENLRRGTRTKVSTGKEAGSPPTDTESTSRVSGVPEAPGATRRT